MKIIELKSSNIKKLKAVELRVDKDKNLVMVTGKNAAGKSSLLDSIWYALGGKKNIPDEPIRKGEEKGEITINLDGYIVVRTFTDKGSYLKITNKDGSDYSNPQAFLDYIVGNLSFDPLEFSRMESKKQIAELIKITGLDLTELEEKKKEITQERLFIGREVKAMPIIEAEIVEMSRKFIEENKDLPSINELTQEYTNATNNLNLYNRAQEDIKLYEEEISALNKKLKDAQIKLVELKNIKKPIADLHGMKVKIDERETINAQLRVAEKTIEDSNDWSKINGKYSDLTNYIRAVDEEKKKKLAEVKMPIEGLGWDEEGVSYNNIPFNQLSGAEQLKISMAIAMASNPKLKVVLIKDGSLLDQDSLKVVEEMAKEKDWQIWVEAVQEDKSIGIYVEDGTITSIDGVPVA